MSVPIRVRLTLWYSALLVTITVCLGTFLVLQLKADLRATVDDEAGVVATAIVHDIIDRNPDRASPEPADATTAEDFQDAARDELPGGSGAQLLDARGRVLASVGGVAAGRALIAPREAAVLDRSGSAHRTVRAGGRDGEQYRVEAMAFRDAGQDRIVVVALSLQAVGDMVRRVLLLLLLAGPVALAASALAAYWLAGKSLRPVGRMTSDAREIGANRLDERLAVPAARDELGRLALTLNAMLDRIERGVTDRHRLVADASHGLRTPLAVMRAELDVSLRADGLGEEAREVLESVREEVDRMSRTVDNLLAVAAADEGRLELLTVRLDLHEAAEEASRPLRKLAAVKGVTLLLEGDRCEARADAHQLRLAVGNLVENAIKFTPPGGVVRVRTWRRATEVGVTVADEGPGVPAEDQPHLFERYYRGEAAPGRAGGSGLGLAICREVAVAHGGRVWVESEPGAGSRFSLALPGWRALGGEDEPAADRHDAAEDPAVAPRA